MTQLVAMHWNRASATLPGPAPLRGAFYLMVDTLGRRLNAAGGLRPVTVKLQAWRRPEGMTVIGDNDFLTAIALAVEPGIPMNETLRCWIQWQHPKWQWSEEPFPARLAIEICAGSEVDQHSPGGSP